MMPLVHSAAPPPLVTPPAPDISRYSLKQFAHWIRDDLDSLVAREGPNILRPDDVLTLHELFVALRQSTTITALDLRATGIHKAVRDIAGIATRWPTRLCDDCDKIITIWRSRLGRFEELHPFLYGRGGRLEGIASASEYTREALLKRWSEHCPERIHPSVSHRRGSLGFKAGDWWIDTLFAHHAGLIGLESVDGGTTYDTNGAYALVLKDMGEIDVRSEGAFTYRCPMKDKGKFRLTAATPASREPIRVLRSHSINSIWGPKAGVRYEGLYSVKGWCIRQARLRDTLSGEWKEGDILYEVTLQRKDPVPIEEVTCRPTNMEVDDYAEYKRLRKLHRELKRKGIVPISMPQQIPRAAPPILPLQPLASPTGAPHSQLRISTSVSRQTTLKGPTFDAHRASQEADRLLNTDLVSPMTVTGPQGSFFVPNEFGTLATPALDNKSRSSLANPFDTSREKHARISSTVSSLVASSPNSGHSDLKEITTWMDLEVEPFVPPASNPPSKVKEPKKSQAKERLEVKAAEMNPVKNVRRLARDSRQPSNLSLWSQHVMDKDIATDALNMRLYPIAPALRMLGNKEVMEIEKKRLTLGKKARFSDGAGYSADEEDDDYHGVYLRHGRFRSGSADDLPQQYSPMPTRLVRLNSLFDHGIEDIEFASPLNDSFPRARAASPLNSPMTVSPRGSRVVGESVALGRLRRWMSR